MIKVNFHILNLNLGPNYNTNLLSKSNLVFALLGTEAYLLMFEAGIQ